MLHLNHLKKSFGKNEILTDIEYTFEEGNIYPVLGGAGAGRTTLFECIAGDIPVDSGTVETKERCTLFFAAKQSVLPMLITGYQFISMLCDMNKNSEKPEYYLDKVKLTGLIRDRHIADYSFDRCRIKGLMNVSGSFRPVGVSSYFGRHACATMRYEALHNASQNKA